VSKPLPQFLTAAPADLQMAAQLLVAGECVALPTETVYGLAADALNPKALAQVFAIKGRPLLDPLIVHVLDVEALKQIAEYDVRLEKISAFWPGPLTVVLRRKKCVPDLVTAGQDTVAARVPAHPVFREVLRLAQCPLAAPSANPFGYVSPTRAQHVRDSLAERCPWIVDGGACEHGLESTIIDLSSPDRVRLLRPGPITIEALREKLGVIEVVTKVANEKVAQAAPGMLERHYSPATRVELFAHGKLPAAVEVKSALLLMSRRQNAVVNAEVFYVSEGDSITEAAANLFDLLRKLDARGFSKIYAELAEPVGLGLAYNDRLTRAAAR
jgi:L-threonylcarbamoyladenylate synthase